MSSVPPEALGVMWSTSLAPGLPQMAQTHLSRLRTCPRIARQSRPYPRWVALWAGLRLELCQADRW